MALPPLATTDDLADRLGDPVEDLDQAQALLDHASAIARAYAGVTWVDGDGALADVPDGVIGVVTGMVERVLSNPAGIAQDSAGPFSVSYANSAERLYLTWADKLILRSERGQAFTIDPTPVAPQVPLGGAPMGPFDYVIPSGES